MGYEIGPLGFFKPTTSGDWKVLGCLGFVGFLGMGLMGLGALIYLRAMGKSYEGEEMMLVMSIMSIAIAILIPVTKGIISRYFG